MDENIIEAQILISFDKDMQEKVEVLGKKAFEKWGEGLFVNLFDKKSHPIWEHVSTDVQKSPLMGSRNKILCIRIKHKI